MKCDTLQSKNIKFSLLSVDKIWISSLEVKKYKEGDIQSFTLSFEWAHSWNTVIVTVSNGSDSLFECHHQNQIIIKYINNDNNLKNRLLKWVISHNIPFLTTTIQMTNENQNLVPLKLHGKLDSTKHLSSNHLSCKRLTISCKASSLAFRTLASA